MKSSLNQKGFSLVELIVVVALIGIIAGIASLGFDFVRRERVGSATKQLLADMLKTRMDGLMTTPTASTGLGSKFRGAGIRFNSATSYTTFVFNDQDDDFAYGGTAEEANGLSHTVSDDLTFQLSSSIAYTALVYDHLGAPRRYTPGNTVPLDPWSDFSIVISDTANTNVRCINVTTNSIREGAWNAGTSVCSEK